MAFRKWRYRQFIKQLWGDPKRFDYSDQAIAEIGHKDFETLELYTATRGGKEAVATYRKMESLKQKARSGTTACA
ncbi:hypothetical protein [Roseibium sp. SCP14]|uniref:hypothetical protein n=1 Tax=Roseibium sp. SCP14 TaxID=3141375 RepID=UPI00333D0B71